nr:hypothetical protein [Tanacetum cinerariifolium]
MNTDVQGRLAESQAKVYYLDLQHAEKVLSMQDIDEAEPAEVEEVIEVVTAAKLMTEVVTTATTITVAQVPKASAPRRRRGVVIQDPEETTTTSVIVYTEVKSKDKGKRILIEEPKPLKIQAQIEQDEAFARQLKAKLNANINWDDKKPVTKAQARKNMMLYLKNMAGFKMDFFKGMTYNEIRPIFEKHYNSIKAFLEKGEEEIKEEGSKRKGGSLNQDAAKKQRINEEEEELKTHLHIVANDDDDVYTEATPLSLKMILLVEKKYPLTHFTLEQMLNNVRLEVKEIKMSLELLRPKLMLLVLVEAQHHISNESPLLRVNTPRCDEDSFAHMELKAKGPGSYWGRLIEVVGKSVDSGGVAGNVGMDVEVNNVNPSYQERRQSMEDTLSKFMSESTKRHEENSNLIKEIRASMDDAICNQGAPIKTLEIHIGQVSKVLQERGFGRLPSSSEANRRDQVKSIPTTIEVDSCSIRHIGSDQYAVSTGQIRTLMYESRQMTISFLSRLNGYYCEENKGSHRPQFSKAYSEASQSISQKEKDIGSLTLPSFINNVCFDNALVELGASKRKITLRIGEEKIVFTSVKPASSLIKKVYMLRLRERMELDLKVRLTGETLVLNRSLDPFFNDHIELNDLNEPIELRRNQGDDLMPTIKEGEVIKEFRTRDNEFNTGIDDYPSYCDYDKKIYIDYAHNLKFSFLENMDTYRDEGIGDVIVGEPFLREVRIKARQFKGPITLYKDEKSVSY